MSAREVISIALDAAIRRGILRHDKYALTPMMANGDLLTDKITESFWLALDDAGVELR